MAKGSSEDTMINLKTIKVKRSMENRIVLCANCDANRTLAAFFRESDLFQLWFAELDLRLGSNYCAFQEI